ncbi:MAG: ABC transporter ATP-binding protein [Acidiferrobacterales bacterium]|nr:ABC transporter ATP-binding protein [Gammaproteobacteria bacterium]
MIQLKQICRDFEVGDQQVHALDHVSLDIDRGEYIAIMGPSGSGKSTLLNIIGLLDRPSAGSYILDGENVTALPDAVQSRIRRDKIGFVFQFFHLVPRLTAAENTELPLVLAGFSPAERRARVDHILQAVGLAERKDHKPDQLSGGQRQRVAIARATILEPAVILADEPTGNLDRASGREVLEVLEKLNRENITLIVVTHDPDIAGRTARQIHIVDGRIDRDIATRRVHEGG